MPYRVFRDDDGAEWTAWDVVPANMAERRASDRRIRVISVSPDRRMSERRVRSAQRFAVSSILSGGWLCFECDIERRRLTPIPADWARAPEAQLVDYCRRAAPVPKVRLRIDRGGLSRPPGQASTPSAPDASSQRGMN